MPVAVDWPKLDGLCREACAPYSLWLSEVNSVLFTILPAGRGKCPPNDLGGRVRKNPPSEVSSYVTLRPMLAVYGKEHGMRRLRRLLTPLMSLLPLMMVAGAHWKA